MSTDGSDGPAVSVLVGGVGELYQGDLDVGRRVVERLVGDVAGAHVLVEDLDYGAVAVAQRLQDVRPHTLVLVGAAARGRRPATVERRRVHAHELELPPAALQAAVGDAVTGYVSIDLVLTVAAALAALPPRPVTIEVEPAHTGPAEDLSPEVAAALDEVVELARAEMRRAPLLELAARLRETLADAHLAPAPAVDALGELVGELDVLDVEGRWGTAFACRDRLRRLIAEGATGEGMDHLDWGLWWAAVEELDRLQALESG